MGANLADLNRLSEIAKKMEKLAKIAPPRQMVPWPYLRVMMSTG